MNALVARLSELKRQGKKAFIPFVTAGDPDLTELPAILEALAEGGADAIEVGIPFSDPIADGPVIQASGQRALERGVTPAAIFSLLANVSPAVPLILMGYANTAFHMGWRTFAEHAARVGVDGVILSDLIPEEADDWISSCHSLDICSIFLVAPTSTDERIQTVAKRSDGFIYAVSRTGVTGLNPSAPESVQSLVNRVRKVSDMPVLVGFGVSTPEQARSVSRIADGVIVGSHLVAWLANNWRGGDGKQDLVQMIAEFKAAQA